MPTQSTDDKLLTLLNARQVNEEDEAYLVEEEKKAKNRLRRSSLYGSGAKAKIPKVKKEKKYEMSPFEVPHINEWEPNNNALHSQVPPASHMDQYRFVTNNTARSRADPDRIFYTTSGVTEGIITVEQPPWYFGNNNKVNPADNNLAAAASRYGFRGARDIAQYRVSTNPVQAPQNTRTEYTPAFLDNDNIIDEWVPPIQASPCEYVDFLKSPKMWPENTRYVTGFKAKEFPQSNSYKRETTVCFDDNKKERPKTSSRLEGLLRKSKSEKENLTNLARMESCKTMESLPMTSQDIFRYTWREKVAKFGSSSLKITMRDEADHPIYEPHTLMDPSDSLKYLGAASVVVHTQTNEEMKFRMQMETSNSSINYSTRWKQAEFFFKGMKSRLKKDKTIDAAIVELAGKLRAEAELRGTPTSLKLSEFVPLAQKLSQFDGFSPKHFIQLFSSFDTRKSDIFRYVEFIASLTIYTNPHADSAKKLLILWKLCEEYGADMTALDMALAVLSSCCASDGDRLQIEALYKESFRPTCYRMASRGDVGRPVNLSFVAEEVEKDRSNTPGKMRRVQSANAAARTPTGNSSTGKEKKAVNLINATAQYNIGDFYLDGGTAFLRVLEKCTLLVEVFDKMLSKRLISMYGNDPRAPAVEEVKIEEMFTSAESNVKTQNQISSLNLLLKKSTTTLIYDTALVTENLDLTSFQAAKKQTELAKERTNYMANQNQKDQKGATPLKRAQSAKR